jgi:hypothetical protein
MKEKGGKICHTYYSTTCTVPALATVLACALFVRPSIRLSVRRTVANYTVTKNQSFFPREILALIYIFYG